MSVTLKRVTIAVFLVYLALTCYTAYVLLSRSYSKIAKQQQTKSSRLSGTRDSVDWNPWGDELTRDNSSRHRERTVEIWGKAAIGLYLWEHIFNARLEPKGGGAWSYGFRRIGDIKFKFRTGPGIVPTTVPQDATHVVLVLNGRAPEKVAAARVWLDALPNYRKLRSVAVVLLGDEACSGNTWLVPYLKSHGGKVAAAFVVYDTTLVDDREVFQWPLGVATYRGFPRVTDKDLDFESERPYPCNFVGTVYPASSRQQLLRLLGDKAAPCYLRARSEWRPLETKESLELYLLALKLSDLTLNPAGKNPECYRIYEALEYGSVPIVEDKTLSSACSRADDGGTFRLLKKHGAPLVYVKNWTAELMPILNGELALSAQEKKSRRLRMVSWYTSFKRAMRDKFVNVLTEKFFGEEAT